MPIPDTVADLQPDLPLEGVRSSPSFWDRTASETPVTVPSPVGDVEEEDPDIAGGPLVAANVEAADRERLGAPAPSHSWEVDLPPPLDAPASDDVSWSLDQASIGSVRPPTTIPMGWSTTSSFIVRTLRQSRTSPVALG